MPGERKGGAGGHKLPLLLGIEIRFLLCSFDWSSKRHFKGLSCQTERGDSQRGWHFALPWPVKDFINIA